MTADKYTLDTEKNYTEIQLTQIARSIQVTRDALNFGVDEIPYDISERLRAARVRAIAQATQKSAVKQPAQHHDASDIFNWKHKMFGWLKGGIAVSAFALALMISVVSIRSELNTDIAVSDRAMSMVESSTSAYSVKNSTEPANSTASAQQNNPTLSDNAKTTLHTAMTPQQQHHRNSLISAKEPVNGQALLGGNSNHAAPLASAEINAQIKAAPVAATPTSKTISADANADDEVTLVLREQIPLQAYLNDDFARFANHQGLETIEKTSFTNNTAAAEK